MSAQSVESILTKAMGDAAFADLLLTNVEKALAGYDLTTEEIAKFKGLTRAQFNVIAAEERKSLGLAGDPQDRPPGSGNHNQSALNVK